MRAGLRVVVAFPHRGDAERTQAALRRVEATLLATGQPLPSGAGVELRRLAAAPRRDLAGRAPGRRLGAAALPASRRRRRRRGAPRARALERRRPQAGRLRRARRAWRRALPRLRHEDRRRRHARLREPPVQGRGPALRPARPAREALALHRRRRPPAGALEARRQGLAHAAVARAGRGPRARRRAAPALRRASDAHAAGLRRRRGLARAHGARLRLHGDRGSGARDRRGATRISPASSRWTG